MKNFTCSVFLLGSAISFGASAQTSNQWQDIAARGFVHDDYSNFNAVNFRLMQTDINSLHKQLAGASQSGDNTRLSIPLPDGRNIEFILNDAAIMAPALAAKYPNIRTYTGHEAGKPENSGRFDLTPHGFHGMFFHDGKVVFVDPAKRGDKTTYVSYFRSDARPLTGGFTEQALPQMNREQNRFVAAATTLDDQQIRRYRIAISATGEYTQYHGGTKELGLAAVVTAINRVTEVYSVDFNVQLELIANTDQVIYTDPATDPFSNTSPGKLLGENQKTQKAILGTANFDVGHVFSTGGGGLADLGVVCNASSKSYGETGSSAPVGDAYYIDYVAHELGHQFGGDHTFNGTAKYCGGGNRSGPDAYEPGSGSTIMAYAGICDVEDLQPHSDAFFHTHSIDQIRQFIIQGGGNSCANKTLTSNAAPVVNAGIDHIIPANTPFRLQGSATDADKDKLSYIWEEMDLGDASSSQETMLDNGNRPIFRSWVPTSEPIRVVPRLSDVVHNTQVIGEAYATTARDLNFRLTARDNKGGVGSDDMKITTLTSAGPFTVTAPVSSVNWTPGSEQTIEWNVANTDQAPISCHDVRINLSADGGLNFDNELTSAWQGAAVVTPNDGKQKIMVPNIPSDDARVWVKCSNNIFFAVAAGQIHIAAGINPQAETEPNSSKPTATNITAAMATINGSISASNDIDWYVVNVPAGKTLTASLNGNAGSNYDLFMTDDSGKWVLSGKNGADLTDRLHHRNNDTVAHQFYVRVNYISGTVGSAGTYTLSTNY